MPKGGPALHVRRAVLRAMLTFMDSISGQYFCCVVVGPPEGALHAGVGSAASRAGATFDAGGCRQQVRVVRGIKHEGRHDACRLLLQGRRQARVVVQPQVVLEPHLPAATALCSADKIKAMSSRGFGRHQTNTSILTKDSL